MIKKRKLCKLANIGYNLLKVGACIAICFDAMCFGNIILNRSGDKRFYKSLFYQDAKLETGGNEILVILHDFSDEEAYIVKQSIREIDYLSANLNYVFADEQYIETDQVLNIYNNCDLSNISAA